ncbi:MAG: HPF/RaiA family ribosome-associated protein [Chloroflexi bacterium]|nr:HPF/RaiA family ribosome-associated protein [Chloroflexota bacterium]
MTLDVRLETQGLTLSELEEERIRRRLEALERRLVKRSEPRAVLILRQIGASRQVTVDLRVSLEGRTTQLVAHQAAETADRAVRLALEDIERQLERRQASQRGEPTFGVPSRRLPKELRPNPHSGPPTVATPAHTEAEEDA